MDSSCPFMAIHSAMEKSNDSSKLPASCPISGKRMILEDSKGRSRKSTDDDDEGDDESDFHGGGQRRQMHHLDAIREEPMEEEEGEDNPPPARGSGPAPGVPPPGWQAMGRGSIHSVSPSGSMRSIGSMRSLSQIGSVASGIGSKIHGTSRAAPSSHGSSRRSARRRKVLARVKEITRTDAPTYSPAELRQHGPLVKESWALLLHAIPWDQLGGRLYESIFVVAPSLQGMFSKSSVAMGIKMVDMIDSMVNNIDDMTMLHKKMEGLGPVHQRNSVHALEHMPVFEEVVVQLLSSALEDKFTSAMKAAWAWLWQWLTESMLVVEKAYNTTSSLIQQSWDMATENMSLEAIGGCIYEALFEIAPNLRHLFSKPKEIMAMKLVNIVGMLVSLSAHPETVDEVIKDLGKRHVTYGVASHHVPIMKQAIMAVLQKLLVDSWTNETAKAWTELWDVSAAAMMKAIDEGKDYGAAIEQLWQKISSKVTPQKFALQLYSRLTNANPELVLVFMHAGGSGKQANEDDPLDAAVRTAGSNFGSGEPASGVGRAAARAGTSGKPVASSVGGANPPDVSSIASKRHGAGALSLMSKAGGGAAPKRSALMTMVDVIERVTGLDIDGDGTVGGDVMAEEDDDLAGIGGGGKKTKFSRLAWGLEIWDLICIAVELMYEPELQKQRLTVIAARFFDYGLRGSHLKTVGMALQGVMGEILIVQTRTPWSSSESTAWDWFWGHVEASLNWTINAYEQGVSDIVHSNWKAIQEANTHEEFGNIFYSQVQEIAPEVLRLFVRPKRLQYSTFVEFMELLVRFSSGPEEFYEQVKPLAIRHMKYGVTAQSVKHFGTVLQNVLRVTLGTKYDEASQKAWHYVWNSVSRCIADCLNVGSNLVTVALVAGDVNELKRALALAPRGQRADWITRVQIHDSVISPLYWAVRDGQLDMARLMIQDLLALRADREAYYYGYDQLWSVHPDIVGVLCKICPTLLSDLFDGMMWHAATVEAGDKVRVNYYVRELLGDPDTYPDAWATPFGVLALNGPTAIFVHPLVNKVLEIKWKRFGMKWFLLLEGWYTVVLVAFEVAFVGLDPHQCGLLTYARLGVGGLAGVTFLAQSLLLLGQVREGQTGPIKLPLIGWRLWAPRWLHKPWNFLRWVSMGMLTFVGVYDPCLYLEGELAHEAAHAAYAAAIAAGDGGNATAEAAAAGLWDGVPPGLMRNNIVCALVAVLLWAGTFQFCTLNHKLSAFTFTAGILVSDVSRVLVVLFLIILAFATALVRVENSVGPFNNIQNSVFALIRRLLQLDPVSMEEVSSMGWFFFLMYALMSIIGMLNILIAQLSQSVSQLSQLSDSYAILHRVHLTLEVETMLPLSSRQRMWAELALFEPVPFEEGYLGPAGGVQCLESSRVMLHPSYVKDRVVRIRGEASPLLPWPATADSDDAAAAAAADADGGGGGSDGEGSEGEDDPGPAPVGTMLR